MERDILENVSPILQDFLINLDDFRFGKTIGQGGCGKVYVAVHTPTGRKCAVKKLFMKELKGKNMVSFCRELEVLVKCDSYFVVPFFGWTASFPYSVVTEYIPNGSLFSALRQKGLSPTQKTLVAMGVAAGMEQLHSVGIIHRDLKSLNILLDENMLPRICDFGLSRFQDDETTDQTQNIGTPHWMAPELFESGDYTNKIDVYAFAILLWEMCTETSPFEGLNAVQIAFQVSKNHARPEFPSGTKKDFAKFVQKCWSPDPKNRPTFKQIYRSFAQKMIYFEGTDLSKVEELAGFIRKDETSRLRTARNRNPPLSKKRKKRVRSSPMKEMPSSHSPYFVEMFTENINYLQEENANEFFSMTKKVLASSEADEEVLNMVVRELYKILSDDKMLNIFVANEVYKSLPVDNREVAHVSLYLLLKIAIARPEIITEGFLTHFKGAITLYPKKMLRIIAPCLQHFRDHSDGWGVVDFLIKNADLFLINAGAEFLQTMHYLCSYYSEIYQARWNYIVNILSIATYSSNRATLKAAYGFICEYYDHRVSIPVKPLVAHISDNILRSHALAYLSQDPFPPVTKELFMALVNASQHDKFALNLIYKFVSSNVDYARTFLSLGGDWMVSTSLTMVEVVSLILIVGKYPSLRGELAAVPELIDIMFEMLETANIEIVDICCQLIFKFISLPTFLQSLVKYEFFERYLRVVSRMKDQASVTESLIMIDTISRRVFVRGFISYIPTITSLLTRESYTIAALSALASLGLHQEAIPAMKKANVQAALKKVPISSKTRSYLDPLTQALS